jgi:hypothetical protein
MGSVVHHLTITSLCFRSLNIIMLVKCRKLQCAIRGFVSRDACQEPMVSFCSVAKIRVFEMVQM